MVRKKLARVTHGKSKKPFGKVFVSEVLRRFPKIWRLVVFSRDELKQFELAQKYPESKFDLAIIGFY